MQDALELAAWLVGVLIVLIALASIYHLLGI